MTRRKLQALAAAVVAALLIAMGAALFFAPDPAPADQLMAGEYDPARAAPEFSLQGSNGAQVTLEPYRGKIVLLTFGFLHCAAVCPTTLATLAQARQLLGEKKGSVQIIFVTVDPERDSAARMREYLAAFDPSFIGATGDVEALANVREDYGVTAVKEGTAADYAMAHTSSIFLIDRDGKLRAMMPFGHDAADFAHDIEILLEA